MRRLLGLVLLIGLTAGALLLSWSASARPRPREIALEARAMAFYLPGGEEANPTLSLRAGETVRLSLTNLDAGFEHDWAAPALKAATTILPGNGSAGSVIFVAPEQPGRHVYLCRLHGAMMRGFLDVRPAP